MRSFLFYSCKDYKNPENKKNEVDGVVSACKIPCFLSCEKEEIYQWIAYKVAAPLSQAHIGYMGEYYCGIVIDESKKLLKSKRTSDRIRMKNNNLIFQEKSGESVRSVL